MHFLLLKVVLLVMSGANEETGHTLLYLEHARGAIMMQKHSYLSFACSMGKPDPSDAN